MIYSTLQLLVSGTKVLSFLQDHIYQKCFYFISSTEPNKSYMLKNYLPNEWLWYKEISNTCDKLHTCQYTHLSDSWQTRWNSTPSFGSEKKSACRSHMRKAVTTQFRVFGKRLLSQPWWGVKGRTRLLELIMRNKMEIHDWVDIGHATRR